VLSLRPCAGRSSRSIERQGTCQRIHLRAPGPGTSESGCRRVCTRSASLSVASVSSRRVGNPSHRPIGSDPHVATRPVRPCPALKVSATSWATRASPRLGVRQNGSERLTTKAPHGGRLRRSLPTGRSCAFFTFPTSTLGQPKFQIKSGSSGFDAGIFGLFYWGLNVVGSPTSL
jgi:hypothetical protein